MEISQLRAFREVAGTLNFTRAAERLHLTQSAISHQIKALEAEMGESLFIRTRRGVKLSPMGKAALEYAQRILEDVETLRELARGRERTPVGRVRAAAATQAFVYLFAPLFEAFMQAYTTVELSFRTTVSTEQTIADILNGVADVGFASLPVYSPSLRSVELFEDELVLAVSREHRFAGESEVPLEEITSERFILFERGASIRRATDDFFRRAKLEPELALESNDTFFVKLMVERGMGISLLPTWAVRDEVMAGNLARLNITGHRLRRSVALVSPAKFQSSATRAFITFILENKDQLQQMAEGRTS